VTAALVSTGAAPAQAAQPERETIELSCTNGDTFEVVVNGSGDYTPARLVGSTRVLIPVSFGDFTFRAELPDGRVETGTEPGTPPKGGGNVARRNPRPMVTCWFESSFTLTEPDEEFGLPVGTVVTFGGAVTGFLTGRR
jgi:hypothetical protein